MEEDLDPFGTPDIAINPNPPPSAVSTLKTQWDSFLADPANRAAMMSFGLQMLQPIGLGQNAAGAIGQAIGQAGVGARQAEELDIKEAEATRKAVETESRIRDREAKLGLQSERVGLQGQALGLSQLRFGLQKEVAEKKLALQTELLDIRRQRSEARTETERTRLDQQERNLQRQLEQLELNRADVESRIESRTDRTAIQRELNDIRRERNATTDAVARARLEQRERALTAQLEAKSTGQAFTEAARSTRALEAQASREAKVITDALKPDPLVPPSRQQVPPQYKQFEGLTYGQIRAKLLNDPKWRKEQRGISSAEPPPTSGGDGTTPAGDPLEGRTATGPNGEKLIRRNGEWEEL